MLFKIMSLGVGCGVKELGGADVAVAGGPAPISDTVGSSDVSPDVRKMVTE